jgi:putative membrane protein
MDMNLDWQAFQNGALAFLLYFGMAAIVMVVFKFLYQAITPYNEMKLIRDGCVPAAITFSAAMIGFAIPLYKAISQAASPLEFLAWAALAAVLQILAFMIVRALLVKDLAARIERGELSVAIYLGAVSITVGLLNSASMTYWPEA